MTELAILERTTCLQLTFRLWSGTRRLQVEDLGRAADDLPPEDLASRGTLKLCNPTLLAPISNVKRAAERDCEQECVSFLRGYATHDANIDALDQKLKARKAEFDRAVKSLVDELPTAMTEWVTTHSSWKNVIEREVPDAQRIGQRYGFSYEFFRVGAPRGEQTEALSSGLVTAARGLSGQLFREIEAEATQAFKKSFHLKDAVGQKAVSPLRRILRKLEALRYLDPRCEGLTERIETVLAGLPKVGPIGEPYLSALVGLLALLGSAEAQVAEGAQGPVTRAEGAMSDLFRPGDREEHSEPQQGAADGDDLRLTDADLDSEGEALASVLPVPHGEPAEAIWI